MNAPLKTLATLIVLGLPIGVVFFLKIFGSNQYDLPVFHQDGPDWELTYCEQFEGAHIVDINHISGSSVLTSIKKKLIIIGDYNEENAALIPYLNRLDGVFDLTSVELILLSANNNFHPDLSERIQKLMMTDEEILQFNSCLLLKRVAGEFVLIDEQGRIRGYYELNNEEELERLMVEVKVLLYE